MVTPDAGRDRKLQVLCLFDVFAGKVSRVEGSGDKDVCVDDVLRKVRIRTLLVLPEGGTASQ